ncbi:amino acid ABC transporter permease [Aminobacter sp. AP02]|uniref:amino acid ABC transporter permease n=1 Tax=Aminobacter sp. AP02 TaxID=2135737 RepID=UPI000D6BAE18|nr:amino acid ABC transporter permease [Aminobacter sp. AP02]PWK60357.1 amino acid ABC transporter membrane protein 1 (PAAT family) [Aminobacter sp. AP02]
MTVDVEPRGRFSKFSWANPKFRSFVVQAALLLLLLLSFLEIWRNTLSNLESRNIASGFDFLSKSAGFDIVQSLIPFTSDSSYGRAIAAGFLNTILVASLGIIAATVIGFTVGIMRLSKNWLASRVAAFYIEFFRNIPLLLQIFIFYTVVLKGLPSAKQAFHFGNTAFLSNRGLVFPQPLFGEGAWLGIAGLAVALLAAWALLGWANARQARTGRAIPVSVISLGLIVTLPLGGLAIGGFPVMWDFPELKGFNFAGGVTVIPEFLALFGALAVYGGAFIAETVRSGVQAVSPGQIEAARSLGLHQGSTLRLVVIPQAMRVVIPPLAGHYLNLTKNSTLAVAIGYPDLVALGGTVLNQTNQAVEIVGIWMIIYLTLSLVTSAFMNWFNSRMRMVER